MEINVSYLGPDPIDNVTTCLRFRMDEVLFFGEESIIREQKNRLTQFLTSRCGVKKVRFYPLTEEDFPELSQMRNILKQKIDAGHRLYFDLTSGEGFFPAACGILTERYHAHLHTFTDQRLFELAGDRATGIEATVPKQNVRLDLEQFLELHGAKINRRLHKKAKQPDHEVSASDITTLRDLIHSNESEWDRFSIFLRQVFKPEEGSLTVSVRPDTYRNALKRPEFSALNEEKTMNHLRRLSNTGMIESFETTPEHIRFSYKNETIKDCLFEHGAVLEFFVYYEELPHCDDCRMAVHLDWDGIIHTESGQDVLNEIDVLTLTDNCPTFISCKTGRMDAKSSLFALYELKTVARRFGGMRAKMILVSEQPLSKTSLLRAKEMGITVRNH